MFYIPYFDLGVMADQVVFFIIMTWITWCQYLICGEKIDEMSKLKFVRGCIFFIHA